MLALIATHCSKGVANYDDPSVKFTWFETNFNMPVPDFTGGTYIRYDGDFTYEPTDDAPTPPSYDLTNFLPGFEICNAVAVFDFENTTGSNETIDTDVTVKWVDSDDSTTMNMIADAVNLSYTLPGPAGTWIEWFFTGNIGCAGWEIDHDDDYYWKAKAVGTPNISEVSLPVTMSNVPSVTQLGSTTPGYIWVQGANLVFICANEWKHIIPASLVSFTPGVTKKGAIWIDETDHKIHWVGTDGNEYTTVWKKKQFASYYSNGPTGEVFAGTSKKGFIWVDNEFGWTHLSYIAADGYKYLTGAGDDPYA